MIIRYENLIHWGGKEVMELSLNSVREQAEENSVQKEAEQKHSLKDRIVCARNNKQLSVDVAEAPVQAEAGDKASKGRRGLIMEDLLCHQKVP